MEKEMFDAVRPIVQKTIVINPELVKEELQTPGMDNLRRAFFAEYKKQKKLKTYGSRIDCLVEAKRKTHKLMNELYTALMFESLAEELVNQVPPEKDE